MTNQYFGQHTNCGEVHSSHDSQTGKNVIEIICRIFPWPGKNTADYLDYVLTRLTVVGAMYLAAVCMLPEILISQYQVPFYFGGTSLLIVVTVTLDTVGQIQSHLIAHQYDGLIKKSKLRGRRG